MQEMCVVRWRLTFSDRHRPDRVALLLWQRRAERRWWRPQWDL